MNKGSFEGGKSGERGNKGKNNNYGKEIKNKIIEFLKTQEDFRRVKTLTEDINKKYGTEYASKQISHYIIELKREGKVESEERSKCIYYKLKS